MIEEESDVYDPQDFIVGDGLSFAFHNFDSIPTKLASSAVFRTARKVDLTETNIK